MLKWRKRNTEGKYEMTKQTLLTSQIYPEPTVVADATGRLTPTCFCQNCLVTNKPVCLFITL